MNRNDYIHDRDESSNTRILSDTERRDFDGVTIEGEGDDVRVDSTPYDTNDTRREYEHFSSYGNGTRVKVIHLGGSGWLSRIILLAILAAVTAAVVIFGGLILTVVGIVVVISAIISFIFGLF